MVLFIVAIPLKPNRILELELFQYGAIGGVAMLLVGLFRRNPVAWWASVFLFGFLVIATACTTYDLVKEFGFRVHSKLVSAYALTLLCGAIFGLLLSVRIRGAYAAPVRPLWEDLPYLRGAVIIMAPLLFISGAVFGVGIIFLHQGRRGYEDRYASTSLKTISTAEADYRANDRDWNHLNDFWTADVQGLYGVVPNDGSKQPIKLIEWSVALADSDPLKGAYPDIGGEPRPKGGAWFVALSEDRSETPPARYRDRDSVVSKFGFLAFPEDFIGGLRYAFLVNENNTIFRRRLRDEVRPSGKTPPGPMTTPGYGYWPSDAELKADWPKLD